MYIKSLLFIISIHECFAGKYITRKIHMKLYLGPEWHTSIFHSLTTPWVVVGSGW